MGMETVKLSRPWLDHAAKETVQVDPLRAAWLRDNGYSYAGEVVTPPRVGPGDHELRPVEPELQSPFPGIEITAPAEPLAPPRGPLYTALAPRDKRHRKGEGG